MTRPDYSTDESFAYSRDASDELAWCRGRFFYPADKIYVDGNSLGLMCRDSTAAVERVVREWQELGIGGWEDANPRWLDVGERLGETMAALVGAAPGTVVATGTTTVNLHALAAAFYQPRGDRSVLLTDNVTFPSDIYALRAQVLARGLDPERSLRFVPANDAGLIDEAGVVAAMDDDVNLIVLSSVIYSTGQRLAIAKLTGAARERGICIGWDCSHSVGAMPHELDACGVDFAFWCGYKYLNGGPGCPAFLYVNDRHAEVRPALPGWWGVAKGKQFDMRTQFAAAPGAGGWQISTPSVIAAAPLAASLALIAEAGTERIRAKSLALTDYLMYLIDAELSQFAYMVGTPRAPEARGGHIALTHPTHAREVFAALAARGVVGDFRPPNIIRIAPVALYNTYVEVWRVVQHVRSISEALGL